MTIDDPPLCYGSEPGAGEAWRDIRETDPGNLMYGVPVYQSVSNVGQWHCGTTKEDEGTQRTHTAHTWSNEVTIRQLPAICYVLAFLD